MADRSDSLVQAANEYFDALVKSRFIEMFGDESLFERHKLSDLVEEMFIGPFGSSLKNECFVDQEDGFCMVYEQKHAIQKTLDLDARFVTRDKYDELQRFNIHSGDIIVSCRGTIGETFIIPEGAPLGIMHPSIMKIRLKPGIYNVLVFNEILKRKLNTNADYLNGSSVKMAITAKDLGKQLFPVPDIHIQNQFADFVRQVDKSKLMFQQMISRYDELVKSRFIEMFGDVVNNTKCWKSGKLQDVSEVTSSKRVFSSDFVESGIPFYRGSEISELSEDGYTKPEYYISRELYEELSKYTGKPKRGDILLPSICSKGELWVVDTDDPFYIKDGRVLWIKTDLSQMNSTFLRYMLRKYIVENFKTMASGSTFAEMKIFILKGIPVVIPPLDLQNQFADFVKQVDKSKSEILEGIKRLNLPQIN